MSVELMRDFLEGATDDLAREYVLDTAQIQPALTGEQCKSGH